MPRYRVTSKGNPSEQFEDDFDDVVVSRGSWVFTRNQPAAPGAGQSFGTWSVSGYTVEVEEHGGIWLELRPGDVPLSS